MFVLGSGCALVFDMDDDIASRHFDDIIISGLFSHILGFTDI